MKKSIRNVLCAGALFCTLTLTSCGTDDDKVKNVEIKSDSTNVFVGESFNYSDLTLQVTTSDNKTETVRVTEEMIVSRPDLSTPGVKELKVKYKGVEYTLQITVSHNVDAYYNKLQTLLTQINSNAKNAKEITFKVDASAGANYFGSTIDLGSISKDFTLTSGQIDGQGLLNALSKIGITIDKTTIKTDSDNLYLTLDKDEFVTALQGVIAEYQDVVTNIPNKLAEELVIDEASVVVDLIVDAIGCGDYANEAFIKTSLKSVFKDAVKGELDKDSYLALITAIMEANGANGADIAEAINEVVSDSNWFANTIDEFKNTGAFEIFATQEQTVYNALKAVAVELDHLKNGENHRFASVLVEKLPTIKSALNVVVSIAQSEELYNLQRLYLNYIDPLMTEQNINALIATIAGASLEDVKDLVESVIKDLSTGALGGKIFNALGDFMVSEYGMTVVATIVSENIEESLFVDAGSTSLKADIKAFLVKYNSQQDPSAEVKKIIKTIADTMGADGDAYSAIFEQLVVNGDTAQAFTATLKQMGFFNVYVPSQNEFGYDVDAQATEANFNLYNAVAIELDKSSNDATRKLVRAVANLYVTQLEESTTLNVATLKTKILAFADELDTALTSTPSNNFANAFVDVYTSFKAFITTNEEELIPSISENFKAFDELFGEYISVDNVNYIKNLIATFSGMTKDDVVSTTMQELARVYANGEMEKFVTKLTSSSMQGMLSLMIDSDKSIYDEDNAPRTFVTNIEALVKNYIMAEADELFGTPSASTEETTTTAGKRFENLINGIFAELSEPSVAPDFTGFFSLITNASYITQYIGQETPSVEVESAVHQLVANMFGINIEDATQMGKVATFCGNVKDVVYSIMCTIYEGDATSIALYATTGYIEIMRSLDTFVHSTTNNLTVEQKTTIRTINTAPVMVLSPVIALYAISQGTVMYGTCQSFADLYLWLINPYYDEDAELQESYKELIDLAIAADNLVTTELAGLNVVAKEFTQELDAFMAKFGNSLSVGTRNAYANFNAYIKPIIQANGVGEVTKYLPLLSDANLADIFTQLCGNYVAMDNTKLSIGANLIVSFLSNYTVTDAGNVFTDEYDEPKQFVKDLASCINKFYNPALGINLTYPVGGVEGTYTHQQVIAGFKDDILSILSRDDVKANFETSLETIKVNVSVIIDGLFDENISDVDLARFEQMFASVLQIKQVEGEFDAESMALLRSKLSEFRSISTQGGVSVAETINNAYALIYILDEILQGTENNFNAEAKYQIHKIATFSDVTSELVMSLYARFAGYIPESFATAFVEFACWASDADKITDANQQQVIKCIKDLATSFDSLTSTQIKDIQNALSKYLSDMDALVAANGEGLSESFMAQYQFTKSVLTPLLNSNIISSVTKFTPILNTVSFADLWNYMLRDAIIASQNGDNEDLLRLGALNIVAGVLSPYAVNEGVFFNSVGNIAEDINSVTDSVYNCLAGTTNCTDMLQSLNQQLMSSYFQENFPGASATASTIVGFVRLFDSDAVVNDTDYAQMTAVVQNMLGLGSDSANDVKAFLTSIKGANDKFNVMVSGLNTLLTTKENTVDAGIKSYISLINASYTADGDYRFMSNGVAVVIAGNQDLSQAEKDAIVAMARIVESYDKTNPEESNKAILELVSMNGFSSILTEKAGMDQNAVALARMLVYVLVDAEDVDYNDLMSGISVPSEMGSVDYNELIAALKENNRDSLLTIDDVKVTVQEDANGNIVSETAKFKVKFNFDAMLGKLYGDFNLDMVLTF